MSFLPDTDMWLLVLGLIAEGHPGTVVSYIFYARHTLKRATITKGSFYIVVVLTKKAHHKYYKTIVLPFPAHQRKPTMNEQFGKFVGGNKEVICQYFII
jgi:hypothetical protein